VEAFHEMLQTRFGQALVRALPLVDARLQESRAKEAAAKKARDAAKAKEKVRDHRRCHGL
jgi:hypothetical protein